MGRKAAGLNFKYQKKKVFAESAEIRGPGWQQKQARSNTRVHRDPAQ